MKDILRTDLPSLRLIAYAISLNHHGSFTRAAQSMGVTQPTFSRGIAALERTFDARLFLRSSRPVKPTPEGTVFLSLAKRLFSDVNRLRDAIGDFQNLRSGRIGVGVGPYPLDLSVLECISRLTKRHPLLQVEIVEGPWRQCAPKLVSGEVEIAVMETSVVSADPRVEVETLPPHQGCFFCRAGHPLADRPNVGLEDVLEYPIVGVRVPVRLFSRGGPVPHQLTVDPMTGDVVPHIETTSFAAACGVVERTDGIGIAVPVQVAQRIRDGILVLLDADSSHLITSYGIAHLKEKPPSPGAQVFIETLKEVEAEVAA